MAAFLLHQFWLSYAVTVLPSHIPFTKLFQSYFNSIKGGYYGQPTPHSIGDSDENLNFGQFRVDIDIDSMFSYILQIHSIVGMDDQ